MIDRSARDQLAVAVRRFAIGGITNRQFESCIPTSKDAAIRAIANSIWAFYDDLLIHRLEGEWALSLGLRRDFARIVLFLKSDLEFTASRPVTRFRTTTARWLSALTAGFWHRPLEKRSATADLRCWPAFTLADYHLARKRPCYLSGKNAL